jgi:hypothetical protein
MKLSRALSCVGVAGALVSAIMACNGSTTGGGGSCGQFYDAYASYLQKCDNTATNFFGERDRFVSYCETELSAPGVTSAYSNALSSCSGEIQNVSASCGKITNTSACKAPAGTLADGTACGEGSQCSSTFCKGSGTSTTSNSSGVTTTSFTCGVCAQKIAIGQPCNFSTGDSCVDGASCTSAGSGNGSGTCTADATPGNAGDPCGMANQTCGDNLTCDYTMKKCVAKGVAGATCQFSSDCQTPLVCTGSDFTKNVKGMCGNGSDVGGMCTPNEGSESGCKSGLNCDPTSKTCVAVKYADPGQPCDDRTTYCNKGSCSIAFQTPGDGGTAPQMGTCPTIIADGAPCDATKQDAQCDTFAYCVGGKCQMFDPASCK